MTVREIGVTCKSKSHKIFISDNGNLFLAGHTKQQIERDLTQIAMGGEPIYRCCKILWAWKKYIQADIPPSLLRDHPKHLPWLDASRSDNALHRRKEMFKYWRTWRKKRKKINKYEVISEYTDADVKKDPMKVLGYLFTITNKNINVNIYKESITINYGTKASYDINYHNRRRSRYSYAERKPGTKISICTSSGTYIFPTPANRDGIYWLKQEIERIILYTNISRNKSELKNRKYNEQCKLLQEISKDEDNLFEVTMATDGYYSNYNTIRAPYLLDIKFSKKGSLSVSAVKCCRKIMEEAIEKCSKYITPKRKED